MTNSTSKLKFANTQRDFVAALNKRVNDYFKTNGVAKHGNAEMVIKTIFMFLLYLVPYTLVVTSVVTGTLGLFMVTVLMGLGVAGIGLSVMHDANHGAYSNKAWVNNLVGYSLHLLGATSFNWKLQHNVLHHSYTNVHEQDEDISPRGALRMTWHSEWKKMHKYQFIYAWFLYSLLTLVWITVKDISRLYRYQKNGFAKSQKANLAKE